MTPWMLFSPDTIETAAPIWFAKPSEKWLFKNILFGKGYTMVKI